MGGGVDDATRTITLDTPITAGLFPTDAQGNLTPSRNTRIRRWDQQGKVLDSNGNIYADLDAAGSTGAIPVPVPGTSILLENGVLASFEVDTGGGAFQACDYWVFAARSNDGTVETLAVAPPRGIHHHYAKLAVVTFPGTHTDCRVIWPPTQSGNDCACTVCVTPQSHASGAFTLQQAVDEVSALGGTVCLHPGSYRLIAPVTVSGASEMRIVGHGAATVLNAVAGAFAIAATGEVGLDSFTITGVERAEVNGNAAILVRQTAILSIMRLEILMSTDAEIGIGISFATPPTEATVRDCVIRAASGIVCTGTSVVPSPAIGAPAAAATSVGLEVRNTTFVTRLDAITMIVQSAGSAVLRFLNNQVLGCSIYGFGVQFPGFPVSTVDIAGNVMLVAGSGIIAGANGVRIIENDIGFNGPTVGPQDGVTLWSQFTGGTVLPDYQVIGNRIAGFGASGAAIRSPANCAMIKQNQISNVGAGVALQYTATNQTTPTTAISIENNQITDVGLAAGATAARTAIAAGIWVDRAASVHVAGNTILRVGLNLPVAQSRVGIFVVASDRAHVSGNQVSDVAPQGDFVGPSVGISILTPFGGVDIAGNLVRRFSPELGVTKADSSDWTPLLVLGRLPTLAQGIVNQAGANAARFSQIFVRDQNAATVNLPQIFKLDAPAAAAPAPVPAPAAGSNPQRVAVHGNQLEGYGSAPVSLIYGLNDCVFADNHCVLATPENQMVNSADVILAATTVIATSNRIIGGAVALGIAVPTTTACSILGNLTHGTITVDGGALPAVWAPLNMHGV